MNVGFKKRFLAYIIDIIIIVSILSIISSFFNKNDNLVNLNNQLVEINDKYIKGEVDLSTYFNQYSGITYNIDKELFIYNLISCFVLICYFVVFPLYNKGMSIGKKILNIRIVKVNDEEVNSNQLIIRYLFIDGLGASILALCLLFVLKNTAYTSMVGILGIIQFLIVIISIFMIIFRKDNRSLPDLIAGTKVVEVK